MIMKYKNNSFANLNFDSGKVLHNWATDLFPICRSITGPGVRETLNYLQQLVPDLKIYEVPSGTPVFDWVIPNEWKIRDAWICNEKGEKLIDFKKNNLHVVGYSESVDLWVTREELEQHIFSLPDQPNAIPYVTSYYQPRWGFCIAQQQRKSLESGKYHVFIDSDIQPGVLNYGELILPGETSQEVFLSTYICHPSMANNELSGIVVMAGIARWLFNIPNRKYTYRLIFIPETIGSLTYLSKNITHLRSHVVAGFNVSCIGDDRNYSYLPSRAGNCLSDRIAKHVLKHIDKDYIQYTWLDRGSDERQYCAPGIDLPVASIMRTKYGEYPEYHTSLDNLTDVVTPTGLDGGFRALRKSIVALEMNGTPVARILGEPQLSKRGLYPTISVKGSGKRLANMMNILSYADGKRDLLDIAELIGVPIFDLIDEVRDLVNNDLIDFL